MSWFGFCAILAFLLIVGGFFFIAAFDKPWGFLLILFGIIFGIAAEAIRGSNTPTDSDVYSGKAIYEETLHITGTDTVRTYKIVWKDERSR